MGCTWRVTVITTRGGGNGGGGGGGGGDAAVTGGGVGGGGAGGSSSSCVRPTILTSIIAVTRSSNPASTSSALSTDIGSVEIAYSRDGAIVSPCGKTIEKRTEMPEVHASLYVSSWGFTVAFWTASAHSVPCNFWKARGGFLLVTAPMRTVV